MKRRFLLPLILLSIPLILSALSGAQPPIAEKIPHSTVIHGTTISDPFHWLKDKSRTDERVLAYLEAENAYTDTVMAPTKALQERMLDEMLARLEDDDTGVPYPDGDYLYYSRERKDLPYTIFCRKHGGVDAPEEVILDVNQLAEGHDFYAVGTLSHSPDHSMLAFSADTTGYEEYRLYIRDLRSGELLPETLWPVSDAVWSADSRYIFYTLADSAGRADRAMRHKLGTPVADDVLLLTEPDEKFYMGFGRSHSHDYIFLGSGSKTTTETRFLKADNPEGEFTLFRAREQGVEYYLDHRGDEFFLLTNAGGCPNFKVMKMPVNRYDMDHWIEYIPHRDSVTVSFDLYKDYMVLFERVGGLEQIRIRNFVTGEDHTIKMPDPAYALMGGQPMPWDSDLFRFDYSSYIQPYTSYEYNMKTRRLTVLKQQRIPTGYDASQYAMERIWAKAADGVRIPIALAYRKDLFRKDGSNPLFLEGYGAYGDTSDPMFFTSMLSLLDRGFIYAVAGIRGGGEMGRTWYDQGKMFNKRNTFSDFITSGEYLIAQQYTCRDKLCLYGASAGGLLVGAVTNMRPDLMGAVIAEVPFVDMLNTMQDPGLAATVSEYEEWGNPAVEEEFRYMLSYSPYENIGAKAYPHMLVIGGYWDVRVNYWEPAKYVAKMRTMKTGDAMLLLQTNFEGGHGGSSSRDDYYRHMAFVYSFVIKALSLPLK